MQKLLGKWIEDFIRKKVGEAGAKGVVLGLSGGVDSALVASLCAKALGNKKVIGVISPESETINSKDIADAKAIAKTLGIKAYTINISKIYSSFKRALPIFKKGARIPNGNLKARIRMCILYYFANSMKLLVAGTGNKSEIMTGYFTLHGDGAADFFPLGDLYKKEVRELARAFRIPERIVRKIPSAGLWRGQSDEDELGITYEMLDEILPFIEKGRKASGFPKKLTAMVSDYRKRSAFKRRMPEICKVNR